MFNFFFEINFPLLSFSSLTTGGPESIGAD
jgi:hypothetical protein